MEQPVDDFTRAVALVLKRERDKPGQISYTRLEQLTGISRSTLVRVLKGERHINLRYLTEICAALDLDMVDTIRAGQAETPLAP